jgi:hypothetical protein
VKRASSRPRSSRPSSGTRSTPAEKPSRSAGTRNSRRVPISSAARASSSNGPKLRSKPLTAISARVIHGSVWPMRSHTCPISGTT